MEIAKKAGVIDGLIETNGAGDAVLFPEVPEDHSVMRAAGMNMICNVFRTRRGCDAAGACGDGAV